MPTNSNNEGAENSSDFPRTTESKTFIVTETETLPTNNLTVLRVAAARQPTPKESEKQSTNIVCQGCLLLSIDEGIEVLVKFLRDIFDTLSGN